VSAAVLCLGVAIYKLSSGAKAHCAHIVTPGLKPRPPKENTNTNATISNASNFLYSDSELIELFFVHRRRRIGHQILRGGRFREGDHFADGFLAGEQHDDAINAKRDAAVRRRAISQRVEEKAKAAAQLFFGQAERFEQALLNILAVDSDAAGAELVTVQNKVVAFGSHFPGRGFQFFQVLVDDAGERMLCAHPGLFRFAPL
jgi:hypothetical protein